MERRIVTQIMGVKVSYTEGDPHIHVGEDKYENTEHLEAEVASLNAFVEEVKRLKANGKLGA